MGEIPRIVFFHLGADVNVPARASTSNHLNDSGKSFFGKINSCLRRNNSMPNCVRSPSEGLALPVVKPQNGASFSQRLKNKGPLKTNKILNPIDIEKIRTFEPKSKTDAMESVQLARHALLHENANEVDYFLPHEVSKMLEKAQNVAPETPDIELWLGLCARRQICYPNEKEMAKRAEHYLGKVLQKNPEHRDARAHYAASLWMTAKVHNDQNQSSLNKTLYEQLLQKQHSDIFLSILALQCSFPDGVTSNGLRDIEKIARENVTNIPIQTFLLSAYYDCFTFDFTSIRDEVITNNTFYSIYNKTLSCLENLKLLDPTSAIVRQTEGGLQINKKETIPIGLSGLHYKTRTDAFFYGTLPRQDAELEKCTPFNPDHVQNRSSNIYSTVTDTLPSMAE